jgi:sporulation protein YlmC with PRC-barrel domain
MKKTQELKLIAIAATLCVVSVGSTVALAQEASTDQPQMQQPQATTTAPAQPQEISKCSQLIGTKVENQQGDRLGKISDVVVSFDNNRVSYCVLSVNHGIFAKARFLAVPLTAFQPSADGSCLILNATKANLARARGFERGEWPSAITPVWGAEPAAPVELPPAVVYGPPAAAPPAAEPAADPLDAEPIFGTAPVHQTASGAIDEMHLTVWFGAPLMPH